MATSIPPSPTLELPTLEPSPTIDINAVPPVKYPEGGQYILFYNETSFFILDRSYNRRSISGISFQRLDGDGLPADDFFNAYEWKTPDLDYLPRNFCANITIDGDQDPPYLKPDECIYGVIKTIQPRFDRPGDVLFWTPNGDSTPFRVSWLEEEVAHCDIDAGRCEVFTP